MSSFKKKLQNADAVKIDPIHWFEDHGDYLFRFAQYRTGDTQASEELVQETLLTGLRVKEKFRGNSSVRTWLIGILKNKIMQFFQKKTRERLHTEDNYDYFDSSEGFNDQGKRTKEIKDWKANPQEIFEKKECRRNFYICVSKLPKALFKVFTMNQIDKIPSKEVCKVLNITETNLWVMLHRARNKIRECMEKNWIDSPERTRT